MFDKWLFIRAIRADTPYNEVVRGAEASLVTSMGRMAAHTGKTIMYDQMASCEHEFAPDIDKFTVDSPAPLLADAHGKYPVPQPGARLPNANIEVGTTNGLTVLIGGPRLTRIKSRTGSDLCFMKFLG